MAACLSPVRVDSEYNSSTDSTPTPLSYMHKGGIARLGLGFWVEHVFQSVYRPFVDEDIIYLIN
jgi:hypothetical protein